VEKECEALIKLPFRESTAGAIQRGEPQALAVADPLGRRSLHNQTKSKALENSATRGGAHKSERYIEE
jgi:hypothetical protein